jgi:hypothetical protein
MAQSRNTFDKTEGPVNTGEFGQIIENNINGT